MNKRIACPYCTGTLFDHKDDCAADKHYSVGDDGTMYKDGEPIGRLVKPGPEVIAWAKACIATWDK